MEDRLTTTPEGSEPLARQPLEGPWMPVVEAMRAIEAARAHDPSVPLHRLGHYELLRLLGVGGMGIVFEARDLELGRIVALKLWKLDDDDAANALMHEARMQARVSDPHVVSIYETGMIGEDVYLAMEFISGTDAREWMLAHPGVQWPALLALLLHAARGLVAIHDAGLVHADIKPENILIADNGRVLVADFGIARVVGELELETEGSSGQGTRAFMAPERLARLGTRAASDQYSFCVMVWECLHGRLPFAGESAEELLESIANMRPRVGDLAVPVAVNAVLLRGMSFVPEERYADMRELLQALYLAASSVERRARRRVWTAGWVMSGALCVCLGYGLARWTAPADDVSPTLDERPAISTTKATSSDASLPWASAEADEIRTQIERGELDAAFLQLEAQRSAIKVKGGTGEDLSLAVAVAFFEAAVKWEKTSPASAQHAIEYCVEVSSSLIQDELAPPGDIAIAQAIAESAEKLYERISRHQSKHSTVPSTVE